MYITQTGTERKHLSYVVVAHNLRLKKIGILIFSATPDVDTIFNPIFSMNPRIPTNIKDTQNLHWKSKDPGIWNIEDKKKGGNKGQVASLSFSSYCYCSLPGS